ncbi:MAG TPA: hypothetical protein VGR97_05300, partial [Candidatus Acidoferrales bacterium]|nr:hypothetical protein [Candidatus Acidoferrales bacterium]
MPRKKRLSNLASSLNRHAMLLWGYFTQYVKVQIGYRADFLISLGTSFAATVFQLGFVLILFQRIPR